MARPETNIFLNAIAVCALTASVVVSVQGQSGPSVEKTQATVPGRAILDKYCVGCHNQRARVAGLLLDTADLSQIPANAATWEKVVRKLHSGAMPPPGMPRPDQASINAFVAFVESTVDRAAAVKPNPGRTVLRRLNRAEYANAIHDLLGLEVDVTSLLPPDDTGYGFDNNADALGVSPIVLEKYLSASRKVSALAVGDVAISPGVETYRARNDLAQETHIEGLPLGTRGGVLIRHNFPLDGEYLIKATLARNNSAVIRGLDYPHEFELTLDNARVHHAPVGGKEDWDAADHNPTAGGDAIEARLQVRIPVKAGVRSIGATFLEKTLAPRDELLEPFERSNTDPREVRGVPIIDRVSISGPFNVTGPGDTPSRRKIFVCRPVAPNDEVACAKKIIAALARRAYRRPVTDGDLEAPLSFYQRGRNQGSFDKGIELALRFILTSPNFVFRFEFDPGNAAPDTAFKVSDLELASRLSFFLWSSIPDDELITLARQGKLKDPAMLEKQVRRMLADSRSRALVDNFADQWLFLRNLKTAAPDPAEFPNFDDNLRQAMRQETEMFFESVMREDRSVLDLLNANYTFVNDRLARHYGIKNIYGSQFRRITVADDARRGLLGQASVLTVTSNANRTSPVQRGKWILENILGAPPPPPPPNVPALKENTEGSRPLSVRERMESHRANPACASCHKVMDPLGFALENFDAVGQWRARNEAGGPVDASGQLADGSKVDGVVTLRQALLARPDTFAGTLTEKLLTYALGRGLQYYDMPAVRAVIREAARKDYRFSSLIVGIVDSVPFQMRFPAPPQVNTLTAGIAPELSKASK